MYICMEFAKLIMILNLDAADCILRFLRSALIAACNTAWKRSNTAKCAASWGAFDAACSAAWKRSNTAEGAAPLGTFFAACNAHGKEATLQKVLRSAMLGGIANTARGAASWGTFDAACSAARKRSNTAHCRRCCVLESLWAHMQYIHNGEQSLCDVTLFCMKA